METNWIKTSEQLPPDNDRYLGESYIVTVTCDSWKEPVTMIMNWECKIIRNKEVKRWLWHDKIKMDSWEVIAWMPLPEPYKE
jgi:hypothetical protein